jgi:hypothetical protein
LIMKTLKDIKKVIRLPALLQSARCPVVSQPYLAAHTPKS